jgi:hypothetical protein
VDQLAATGYLREVSSQRGVSSSFIFRITHSKEVVQIPLNVHLNTRAETETLNTTGGDFILIEKAGT